MKRKIVCLLLAVLMIFSAMAVLTSCGGETRDCKKEGHLDEDGNLMCDVCGSKIKCKNHVDEDGNDKCDKCDADMSDDVIVYPWHTTDLVFQMSLHSSGQQPSGGPLRRPEQSHLAGHLFPDRHPEFCRFFPHRHCRGSGNAGSSRVL